MTRTIFGNPNGTYAQVIADSISPLGYRVTTMEVQTHRFVLAEFNTHRVFSRNSASSRAIPFPKQVGRVMENPAMPLSFPAERAGMQGGEELSDGDIYSAKGIWLKSRDAAVEQAQALHDLGVHKSVVNRLLEPFMWHRIIVTATEWDNFFGLRVSPLAQPEIRAVAVSMRDALASSSPEYLSYENWHVPYIEDQDYDALAALPEVNFDHALQVSSARCARVSYLTHDGIRDIVKDIDLYEKLASADPQHASPMEHPCRPATPYEIQQHQVLGNFDGWVQYRHARLEA